MTFHFHLLHNSGNYFQERATPSSVRKPPETFFLHFDHAQIALAQAIVKRHSKIRIESLVGQVTAQCA
jgi:hypothetical protein